MSAYGKPVMNTFLDSTFVGSGFFDSFSFVTTIGLSTPILKNILQAGSQLENGVVAYKLRKKISAN